MTTPCFQVDLNKIFLSQMTIRSDSGCFLTDQNGEGVPPAMLSSEAEEHFNSWFDPFGESLSRVLPKE
jgi:hypothetical protein